MEEEMGVMLLETKDRQQTPQRPGQRPGTEAPSQPQKEPTLQTP